MNDSVSIADCLRYNLDKVDKCTDLDDWFKEQEQHFKRNKIQTDDLKIKHILLFIDVQHWSRVNDLFKHEKEKITYQTIKRSLLDPESIYTQVEPRNDIKSDDCSTADKRAELLLENYKREINRLLVPDLRYGEQVNKFIDDLAIDKINLEILVGWLKNLRFICNGAARDDYLITKLLVRVVKEQKQSILSKLLKEIRNQIEFYESIMKANDSPNVGKRTVRKWQMYGSFLTSIEILLLKHR